MEATSHNDYGGVASIYDFASHLYSGGQIRACKEYQIPELMRGDRVLYAGAGTGFDAALAAKRGAEVTVVELAAKMAERAQQMFVDHDVSQKVELIVGDIFDHERLGHYDAVVANFFLNVFSEERMRSVLAHLTRLARVGGKVMIADFAPESVHAVNRVAQRVYFGIARTAFQLLAKNASHPLYDYSTVLEEAGLEERWSKDFRLFGVGPEWYRTLVTVRIR